MEIGPRTHGHTGNGHMNVASTDTRETDIRSRESRTRGPRTVNLSFDTYPGRNMVAAELHVFVDKSGHFGPYRVEPETQTR